MKRKGADMAIEYIVLAAIATVFVAAMAMMMSESIPSMLQNALSSFG
ncbi:MAG: hypothetical protein ABEJ91_02350 [Candidatus Nanohaloarchaea archaeon]